MSKEQLFEVSVTAIIKRRDGKILLLRRSANKKRFPEKWTVPGGHVDRQDYIYEPSNADGWWYGVLENAARREVMEEAGLHIENIRYLTSMVTEQGGNVIVVSLVADLSSEDQHVKIKEDESSDFAWVNLVEARSVDLIDGIYDELLLAAGR